MNKKVNNHRDFRILSHGIRDVISANEKKGLGDQKQQVDLLLSLETKFKSDFLKLPQHVSIYEKFILYVKNELGNILIAKTFFREKNPTFNKEIGVFIRQDNAIALAKYNFNYNFIKFMIANWEGEFPPNLEANYKLILEIRSILVENNLPLAINRAKNFFKKTHPQDMTMNDMIGICVQGLLVGIDKYVGEYTVVWRSVCIGRMVGFMIKEFNENIIKMHPKDKAVLYRANTILYRQKPRTMDDLAVLVIKSYEDDKASGKKVPKIHITPEYLESLLNSSHKVNPLIESNAEPMTSDRKRMVEREIEDEEMNGSDYENNHAMSVMRSIYKDLSIIEIKILRLKGVKTCNL